MPSVTLNNRRFLVCIVSVPVMPSLIPTSYMGRFLLLPWFSPLLSPFCVFICALIFWFSFGVNSGITGVDIYFFDCLPLCFSHFAVRGCSDSSASEFLAFKPWKFWFCVFGLWMGICTFTRHWRWFWRRWCSEHTAQNSNSSPGWRRVTHLLAQDGRCRSHSEPPASWIFFSLFCC